MGELRRACLSQYDQNKIGEDKLALTIFCFAYCVAFKFLNVDQQKACVPIIQHAVNLLQGKDMEELFCIAATAIMYCVGYGYADGQELMKLCSSEVVEVQQRACEAYVLMQMKQGQAIPQLYEPQLLQ